MPQYSVACLVVSQHLLSVQRVLRASRVSGFSTYRASWPVALVALLLSGVAASGWLWLWILGLVNLTDPEPVPKTISNLASPRLLSP